MYPSMRPSLLTRRHPWGNRTEYSPFGGELGMKTPTWFGEAVSVDGAVCTPGVLVRDVWSEQA
jgi:hypothetical protein